MPNNNTIIDVGPEISKKKKTVGWRNNVNVRNITYTRKATDNNNRKNNFNRNTVNYKSTIKNTNGPTGKSVSRLTRNNANVLLPPEHSFGERYFTDES